MSPTRTIAWFSEVDKEDIPLVGGKGANLGEMASANFPVPPGFIVTANAYYTFLKENRLATKIQHLLQTINFDKHESLAQVSLHIKKAVIHADVSEDLTRDIVKAYNKLGGMLTDATVAIRSSATAEDLPTASFAGQQETFLNVKGDTNVVVKVKEAWASLFDARAIFYRHQHHFSHFRVGIAIVVQKMVNSEKSGVMFTIDPVSNEKSKIVIESIYGLGELIVQGRVIPDHYEVDKQSMSILLKTIGEQKIQLQKVGGHNKEVHVDKKQGTKQKITDEQIIHLAKLGKKLEQHYYFPQDVEWAIEKKNVYLVQTRPVTTTQPKTKTALADKQEKESKTLELLLKGDPASPGIASGPVKIIKSAKEIDKVLSGDILVAPSTNPDFVPAMKKAVAIVTDSGGRTSHAAIVSREIGIPAVVGTQTATKILKNGNIITVNGLKGEIYRGGYQQPAAITHAQPEKIIKTATKIYVNLAEPEFAERVAGKNVDGVGLLRAEFMIAGIGTHPKKLIRDGKKKLFIEKMTQGLETFCKAFNPRPVIYRASDLKTNEYRGLIGGQAYEPQEPNPMLGFRGAIRYIHDPEVFELELEAIMEVRNKKGYKNLWLMLPFVRTVKELIDVKKIISAAGLYRSPSFKLWMMVEIPSNVILLDKFIEVGIDGISIGSNDLTMLLLGTDRDNSEVARAFDEQNEAVLWALERAIKTAHKYKITSSICGQAPSLYPNLVEKLIQWGITSVSVSPDAIEHTRENIQHFENRLIA